MWKLMHIESIQWKQGLKTILHNANVKHGGKLVLLLSLCHYYWEVYASQKKKKRDEVDRK